jgi:molecular chaperone GrpE
MPDGPNDKPTDGAGEPEEAEGGTLAMDPELEAALREATESVGAIQAERDGEPGAEPAEGELAARAEELEAENAALQDRLLRLQADFDNHRRRTLKERQDALQYGHENLVKDLLGTVDNLERAIEHASQSDGGDLEGMLQGVELVQRELLAALAQHAVSEIEVADGVFDPNLHEAMAQVEDPERPPGSVVQVLQKGYQLRDRLLRPTRVLVSKAPVEAEPKPDSEDDEEAAEAE